MRALSNRAENYLENFNLFPSATSSTDAQNLRMQLISTRIFICLLLISISTLLIYISNDTVIKSVTLANPNVYQFENFYQYYSQSLACPCAKINTDYRTFVNITVLMHPLCDSMYVTDAWIQYIVDQTSSVYWTDDFRSMGSYLFQALRSLCDMAKDSISDSLSQFYRSSFVTAFAVPRSIVQSQYETVVDQFISTTTNSFYSHFVWHAIRLNRMQYNLRNQPIMI